MDCGGRHAGWHLEFAKRARAAVEPRAVGRPAYGFVDFAFDEFRVAAEFGYDHDQLDVRNEPTRAQSYEPAISSRPFTVQRQRFLSSGGSLIMKRKTLLAESPKSGTTGVTILVC